MRIRILSIGKFENSPHKTVFDHYLKRLKWKVELKELELRNSDKLSSPERKKGEGELILKTLKPSSKLIICDENGEQFTSQNFAKLISNFALHGSSDLTFVIGGSDGLGEEILQKSKSKIAFGKMTLPHLMVRVILIEQLYRAQTIIEGHPYHRQ
jgi:23S rRNA (pseudouridine1915-N3)-methyltransferase